jgi:nucleoside-diphosphate-sugar epimerase
VKVLLTGALGFLGTAVSRQLNQGDYQVIAVARSSDRDVINADLSSPQVVLDLLNRYHPDVVVNCAARIDFAPQVLPLLYSVNTVLPALLANWCSMNGGYLIHPSSIAVHGSRSVEAGPAVPIILDSDYGRSKWLAEQNIEASGCTSTILRFGGLFGLMGPRTLYINRAIREAREGRPPALTGDGMAKRNYVFVHDAAALISYCIEQRPLGTQWVGGREILTIRQMLQCICDSYLPDKRFACTTGPTSTDQIVQHSSSLPLGRSFREAIEAER